MSTSTDDWPLAPDEYERYGRQMIMPDWGLDGQLKLRSSKVAVVGAGGLGCPLLQYLAGSGVGTITIFDHDTVSRSNLHRQVLHTTERVGMNKALSACIALKAINPLVELVPRTEAILPFTALSQLDSHDLIIDCTDRPFTRYLISDAAVLLNTRLVSGAAVGAAGQWAVYGGSTFACYRCMWPSPGASQRCDDTGVWGPVTGMVGCAMAAEALRVLISGGDGEGEEAPKLHILHLGGTPMVRAVRMRGKSPKCGACSPGVRLALEEVDYAAFCGEVVTDEATGSVPGGSGERIDVEQLRDAVGREDTVVVDTRPRVEYGICSLPGTTNVPLATILAKPGEVPTAPNVVFLCRRGNDSQLAAASLRAARPGSNITDVRGGLTAWTRKIDARFPTY